jgi:hypothetical protein
MGSHNLHFHSGGMQGTFAGIWTVGIILPDLLPAALAKDAYCIMPYQS